MAMAAANLADRLPRCQPLVGFRRLLERHRLVDANIEILVDDPAKDIRSPPFKVFSISDVVRKARARQKQRSLGIEYRGIERRHRAA